ncbi:MAG: hypothetical protein J2P45_00560 [Candidatus Dormibacteraeota bacterium]|nr:hypothetical protein [Candidatus Dormibacteraeota bacterium]
MKYAVLIYEQPGADDRLSPEERQAVSDEYLAIREDPRIIDGVRLERVEMTTTIRIEDGETLITDGPFADTKEVFGGYYLVEADHLDAAIEIAERIPAARRGGAIEIRPLMYRHT